MSPKRKSDDSDVKPSLLEKLDAYPPSGSADTPRTPKETKVGTPKTSPDKSPARLDGMSPKGRLFLFQWENGVLGTKKEDAAAMTGLAVSQQNDMLRRDKGSLRKAVEAFAGTL